MRLVALVALLVLPSMTSAQQIRSGFVPVGADRLYFEATGTGEAILLLHDGLVHSAGMDELFRVLAERYHVIRYDRRGYGRSDTPSERYSPIADALAVLKHLDVDRAVLLGASAGGGGAIELALAHPDRVSALVLVGAVVNGHPYSEHFQRRGQENMAPLAERDYRAAMRNWADDPYLLAPGHAEARERLWALLEPYAEKHLTNPFELVELPGRPAADRFSEIRTPTLIVVGAADIPDVHAHAGVIEAGIVGSKRRIVEDAGHLVFFERPEALGRLVMEFLSERNRQTGPEGRPSLGRRAGGSRPVRVATSGTHGG